ncbi:chorismate mutase [Peptostreptococcaceae bacterium OttesenSCG-928-C18]|nr:chorismate mutase [Peptostreptococcaceae bacterium OttesenSCG-928-C18]
MNNLSDIRNEIDNIDKELVYLFEKRMDLVRSVIEYKIKNNLEILDADRENLILKKNKNLLINKEYSEYVDDLFLEIMKVSRNMQNNILKEKNHE